MIPKSGGDYAYINEAFGPLPAFLYLWVALFVIVPTGNAITALTFAQYILKPSWPGCEPPVEAVRLIAAVITCKHKHKHRHAFLISLSLSRSYSTTTFVRFLSVLYLH